MTGLAALLARGHPLVLACDGDVGGLIGIHCRDALGLENPIVSIDGLALHDFDHPNRPPQVRTGYAFSADGSGRIHTGTNAAARADSLKRVPQWLAK